LLPDGASEKRIYVELLPASGVDSNIHGDGMPEVLLFSARKASGYIDGSRLYAGFR
jgi:hypothetical protein